MSWVRIGAMSCVLFAVGTVVTTPALGQPHQPAARTSVSSTARAIDLAGALRIASQRSPLLEQARARIAESQGDLTQAALLLVHNPELSVAAGPRLSLESGTSASLDVDVELSQTFELGGQRGHRKAKASASVQAAKLDARHAALVVEAAVTLAFYETLAASKRGEIEARASEIADRLMATAKSRVERGEGVPLEINTARIGVAQARQKVARARAALDEATIRLTTLLGLPPTKRLRLRGDLPRSDRSIGESQLVARAVRGRPDLQAVAKRQQAADADAKLQEGRAWPDLTVGVSYTREPFDQVWMAGLSIPIPLFARNQGGRQRAAAIVRRLRAEHRAAKLRVESQVRSAYARYLQAKEALKSFDNQVLQAQAESLAMLQRSYEAGQIPYSEVLVLQRQILEGQTSYLSARLDYANALVRLRAAVGVHQTDR